MRYERGKSIGPTTGVGDGVLFVPSVNNFYYLRNSGRRE